MLRNFLSVAAARTAPSSSSFSALHLSPASSSLCFLNPLRAFLVSRNKFSTSSAQAPSPGGAVQKGGGEESDVLHRDSQEDREHFHHTEIKGLYDTPVSHHGDPRGHLWSDGTRRWEYTADSFHWDEYWANVPKQELVVVNGQKMIKGALTRPMEELFCTSQKNIPFWARTRLNIWGNYPLILKAEFLFFWIPTAIIWTLAIPCFTMIYMMDEAIYTTMTVKVIGRQWYWVYEVESPPEGDEEEGDEE